VLSLVEARRASLAKSDTLFTHPYIYGVYTVYLFGREITKYTVIYGAYIRFWPTLQVCERLNANLPVCQHTVHTHTHTHTNTHKHTHTLTHTHTQTHTHTNIHTRTRTHTHTQTHTHTHTVPCTRSGLGFGLAKAVNIYRLCSPYIW